MGKIGAQTVHGPGLKRWVRRGQKSVAWYVRVEVHATVSGDSHSRCVEVHKTVSINFHSRCVELHATVSCDSHSRSVEVHATVSGHSHSG